MILTLFGYTPPARYDGAAWTAARIEQATTQTGSYTLVEQVDLDPIDIDPRDPAVRGFTTELATVGDWYRIVWVDEDGNESDATEPVQLVESPVTSYYGTTDELAQILSIRTPTSDQTAAMERVLLVATGEVLNEVGRGDLAGWELSLATEVVLERGAEHWAQLKAPFGFVGLGGELGPSVAARDSWDRHAYKLAPLKGSWGIA